MARKDVDLVIRAKNEASKAISSVDDALKALTSTQEKVSAGAGKTDSALGRLGSALAGLDKQLGGMSATAKIASEMDKATAAMARAEAESAKLAKDHKDLADATERAKTAEAGLRVELEKTSNALKQQSADVAKTKTSQNELNAALRTASAERQKLQNADERMVGQIDRQEAAVAKAEARYRKFADAMAQAEKPTKGLQASLASAAEQVEKQKTKLDSLSAAYIKNRAATESAAGTVGSLASKLATNANVFEQQKAALASTEQSYASLKSSVRDAATNQQTLQAAADATGNALQRQNQNIATAKTSLDGLAQANATASTKQKQLAIEIRGGLIAALTDQRTAMATTQAAWKQAEGTVKTLAVAMAQTATPTKALVNAFNEAKSAAALAKGEFISSRDTVQGLQGAITAAGGNYDRLAAAQVRFSGVQSGAAAGLRATGAAAAAASSATTALATASGTAANGLKQTGSAGQQAASGFQSGAKGATTYAEALKAIYGESRQAMSWTQRLRGEVLSLITAYVGIQGVIGLLKNVVTAYQTLEAATSRLNVAFDGDKGKTSQELDYLRRMADRLGVEFGTLASEYGKFAVATKGTNLEGEKTRTIFRQVTEAARVNKTSLEDTKGVFLALTQIVSKGTVQMEELRQQLGDRLPGALQLMADGLGVSTAQLIKMMEAGEVTSDALIGFGNQLEKKFGPELANSLNTMTTAMGRLQNAVFQALISFGNAGFIEKFTQFVNDLTTKLKSPEGEAFIKRLSGLAGSLVSGLGLVVKNIEYVTAAFGGLIALRVVGFFTAINAVTGVSRWTAMATSVGTASVAMAGVGTAATGAAAGVGVLRVAMTALMSSTGIGLLVAAIGAGITLWSLKADDATEAMVRHKDMVDKVKNAYDAMTGKQGPADLSKISTVEAQEDLKKLKLAADEARKAVGDAAMWGGISGSNLSPAVYEAVNAFKEGRLSAEDFRKKIDELGAADPGLDRNVIQQLLKAGDAAIKAGEDVKKAEAVLALLSGTATEAQKKLLGLTPAFTENGNAAKDAAEKGLATYKTKLDELKESIPGVAEELKRMNEQLALGKTGIEALKAAIASGDFANIANALNTFAAARNAQSAKGFELDSETRKVVEGAKSGTDAAVALLKKFEGFISSPKWDVNAMRVGYGSDTVTLSDGSIKRVTEGMAVSVEDANRDLARRVTEFTGKVVQSIGAEKFNSLNAQQQGALTSIAYNYGSLPERIVSAIKTGTTEDVANAIRALGSDNNGINQKRRTQEAQVYNSGGAAADADTAKQAAEAAEKAAKEEEKRVEKAKEGLAGKKESLALDIQTQALDQQKTLEAAIQKATLEAQAAAKKGGYELDAEALELIKKKTTAEWEATNAAKAGKDEKKGAAEAEKQVQDLMKLRTQYESTLKTQLAQGDMAGANQTKASIEQVNVQLKEAIANAIAMYQALGGPGADVAIAKLQNMSTQIAAAGQTALLDWTKVGNLFASGLTSAFDSFAKAVAEGKDVGEAAREAFLKFASDFLRQIAQMIIQQTIMNALKSAFGGGGILGGLFGGAGVSHAGGIAGSSNRSRRVDMSMFAGAVKYHQGGVAGLKPNEVPSILERGEEILTKDDPRHMFNMGKGEKGDGGAGADPRFKIVNAIDSSSVLEAALGSAVGEKAIINFIRANSGAVKSAMGT